MMLQSLMLGLGAYLVMSGEASSGVIIASSIMLARALAPVDIAIANWRGFMSARQSYAQLSKTLTALADRSQPMALPRPHAGLVGRSPDGRRTRPAEAAHPERHLQAGGGFRAGRHRPERVRQVDAGARPCRRLARAARNGPSRPGCARSVGCRGAWPRHRLSAAGHRTVRRHGCRQHLPLRPGRRSEGHPRGSQSGGRRTHDPAPAGRLPDPGRRRRRSTLGRTAAVGRAGPRSLRRSVPGRARRAQFQSRRRRRRLAVKGDAGRPPARRHRHCRRPPPLGARQS